MLQVTSCRIASPMRRLLIPCLWLLATPALADELPAFDRPGLGFGTDTVPRGALALEVGLPTWQRDRDRDGVRTRSLAGDVLLRTGLSEQLELQVSTTPWQRQSVRSADLPTQRQHGSGDTQLALKWAGPGSTERTAWALLASAVVARGDADFSEGHQYALALSVEQALGERWSAALYGSHQRGDGERSTTWSPSLSLAATDRLSLFVEAGLTHSRGAPDQRVAGAGITWMLRPRVQLDASFDAGLDADSPDLQVGTGLAVYFD